MSHSDRLVASGTQGGKEQDFVLDLLLKFNLPVTRENYLGLAYPEGVPEELDETSLPEQIRQTHTTDHLPLFRELSMVTLPIDPSEPPDSQGQQDSRP
jgi:hypothetical protein